MAEPTASDIVRALNGEPADGGAARESIVEALNGAGREADAQAERVTATLEGREPNTTTPRPDAGYEDGNEWLGGLAVDVARENFSTAMMKADPKLTAGVAEARAKTAAQEAYAVAAKLEAGEGARLDRSAQILKANADAIRTITGG